MADLFTRAQLAHWLHYDGADAISEEEFTVTHLVVRGWILQATQWATIPETVTEALFSWAIELGGIAFENPTSQTDDQTDLVRSAWRDRRTQLMAEIRTWAVANGATVTGGPLPRGRFPSALPYPDPIYPYGLR